METTNKPFIVSSHDVSCDEAYNKWLDGLKKSYRAAQTHAAVKINAERLRWNWNMGRELVMRKVEERWGTGIVEQVSLDLRAEFPNERGFSAGNLWAMKRWYLFYADSFTKQKLENLSKELYPSDSQRYEKLEKGSKEISSLRICNPEVATIRICNPKRLVISILRITNPNIKLRRIANPS